MGYPELRLRSAPEPDPTLSVDDACRQLVEQRIQEFLF
jgi:hypothetical protein